MSLAYQFLQWQECSVQFEQHSAVPANFRRLTNTLQNPVNRQTRLLPAIGQGGGPVDPTAAPGTPAAYFSRPRSD